MLEISADFFTINTIRLEYLWLGRQRENTPTLVFLHEGLGSVAMWKDFPEQVVAATSLPALVFSRQGYGCSEPFPWPRDVSYMHDEALDVLPRVLDAANIEQAILIGHSDGGSISLMHAATDKQQRVRALILLAPHVFNEKSCVDSIAAARVAYNTTDLRQRLAAYHKDVDNTFWGWNDIWLHPDFWHWNIEEYLPDVVVPVLHIQGEDDEYGSSAQAQAIRQKCKGSVEIVMFPDCGHSPHRDQTDKTIRSITKFIDNHQLKKQVFTATKEITH